MKKEIKPVLLALLLVLAIIVVLAALVLVLKPYYLGKTTVNISDLGGENAPSEAVAPEQTLPEQAAPASSASSSGDKSGGGAIIASIPGDVSSCEIIDYGPGIYTLDRNLNASGDCLNISASNIILDCRNYDITLSGNGAAIRVEDVRNVTIINCNIYDASIGILIHNSTGNLVNTNLIDGSLDSGITLELNSTNNTIENNSIRVELGYGIQLNLESGMNVLSGNTINEANYSIYVRRSAGNQISQNELSSSKAGASEIYITNSSRNKLSYNSMNNGDYGIMISTSPYTISSYDNIGYTMYGVYVTDTNHTTINNLDSRYNSNNGVYAILDYNLTVYNASILSASTSGIDIESSSLTNVSFSNIAGSPIGFEMITSNYGYITNNSVIGNSVGVFLNGTNHYLLNSNTLSNGDTGLYLSNSTNNSATLNWIKSNSVYGIVIENSSGNNLSSNTLNNNSYYHIYMTAYSDGDCKNIILNNSEGTAYNSQILYYNDTISLSNMNAAELIMCNADNGYFNNISISSSGLIALRTNNTQFNNLNINSSYNGIFVDYSSNNTFNNSVIALAANDAIFMQSSANNKFTNVSVPALGTSIQFGDSNVSRTYLANMNLGAYDFGSDGGIVIFQDSKYGEIKFLQAISGSGSNLGADVFILNNTAGVNSLQTGLNRSANITLLGLRTNYARPAIFRENYMCSASVCYNFTNLNAGTVIFNVTGWTNYSITEGYNQLTECGVLNESNRIYRVDQAVSTNSTCFRAIASNITLECLDWSNRIVYGNSSGTQAYYGVYSNSTQTKVQNCEITMGEMADGTLERYAIYYYGGSNGLIINVNASGNRQGIVVNSSFNNITGNIASYNSQTGIYMISNANNSIRNNIASNNKFGIRIYWLSDNNTIENNTAEGNTETGLYLGPNTDNNIIRYNRANGNTNGFLLQDGTNNVITANQFNGNYNDIVANMSNTNAISSNIIENSQNAGIILYSSDSNTITGNTVENGSVGAIALDLIDSNGNTATLNKLTNYSYGFYSGCPSKSNTVYSNSIKNNAIGAYLHEGITYLDNNNITGSSSGVYITSTDSIVQYNLILNNSINGVYLANTSSGNNQILSNNISGSIYGVNFFNASANWVIGNIVKNNSYGINLLYSTSNNIYNNIFNNSINANDSGAGNYWNTTLSIGVNIIGGAYLGGNYWNNYLGMDNNGDGMGNNFLPYNNSGLIRVEGDWLPLTKTVYPPLISQLFVNSTYGTNLTTENLTCWVNTTDAESNNVSYYGRWYKNGAVYSSFSTGIRNQSLLVNVSRIASTLTTKNDNWTCEVWAGDGVLNSTTNMTSIIILNSPPVIVKVIVNSTYGTNLTTENLTCWASASDDDGDNVSYNGNWLKNTVIDSAISTGNYIQGILVNISIVDSSVTTKDDNWSCDVSAYDGTDYSSSLMDNLTILNSAPVMTQIIVNSTYGTNLTTENLTCWASATDDDGDNLNYSGFWYKNDAANQSFNATDYSSGLLANISALDSSYTFAVEHWICSARAYDGLNYSSSLGSASLAIIGVCNNSICEPDESCTSCSVDCGSCPSGGGGGGGGGRSHQTFSPSENQLAVGYTNNYYEGDRTKFSFGNETHYISVETIGANSVLVTIYSLPMRITLFLGDSKKVDINGDGYYDLLLRFEALRSSSADILVQRIYESVSGPTYVPPQQPQPAQPEQPKEQIPPAPEKVPEVQAGANTLLIVVIVLAVLIVIIILSIILVKLKAKRDRQRMIENAKKWVEDARKKGYSNKAINKILFKKDWTLDEIKEVMGHHHPEHEHKLGK